MELVEHRFARNISVVKVWSYHRKFSYFIMINLPTFLYYRNLPIVCQLQGVAMCHLYYYSIKIRIKQSLRLICSLQFLFLDCLLGPQPEDPDKDEPEPSTVSGFQPSLLTRTPTCTCSPTQAEEVHITLETAPHLTSGLQRWRQKSLTERGYAKQGSQNRKGKSHRSKKRQAK